MVGQLHSHLYQMYVQYPRFMIDVEPGRLLITNQSQAINIKASDVVTYHLYNNKVRLFLREQVESRNIFPFAKLKGMLEISLNKLSGRIPVTTWLQRFDGDFNVKSKVNLGMIAQGLGDRLS
jgi:hypothetical protein